MDSGLLLVGLLLATCSLALASDPSPLQDFCVADPDSKGIILTRNACRECYSIHNLKVMYNYTFLHVCYFCFHISTSEWCGLQRSQGCES